MVAVRIAVSIPEKIEIMILEYDQFAFTWNMASNFGVDVLRRYVDIQILIEYVCALDTTLKNCMHCTEVLNNKPFSLITQLCECCKFQVCSGRLFN